MPSIFIIKAKIENPTEWYDRKFANDIEWEEDEFLESYHVVLCQDLVQNKMRGSAS